MTTTPDARLGHRTFLGLAGLLALIGFRLASSAAEWAGLAPFNEQVTRE